ncbi:AIM24 family protein [Mobilicoccus massiliensis]|uniref:AIM24 family protein n=1 Tax=Mobilicoccus massiliensis TaxID=1522310 RepID=UPI00058B4C8E|nr:AIM24 family protein [Mobilicoccus massiliensis]
MTIYGPLFEQYAEQDAREPFSKQNSKMLKVRIDGGTVWARAGAMVAYQGEIGFQNTGSGGLGKLLKKAATGEGLSMMKCTGRGEMFLANMAADVQVLYLENDTISVNGRNVLAFSDGIEWDIHRVQARGAVMTGDLYNVSLRGTGFVAVTTKGEPVALDVGSAPTFGDPDAVVLWTQGVTMDVRVDAGGLGSLLRGGSGETFQMAFGGRGHVVVQPAENVHPAGGSSGGSGGGFLGELFDG